MLDGERSYVCSESPKIVRGACAPRDGPRIWRGWGASGPLAAASDSRSPPYHIHPGLLWRCVYLAYCFIGAYMCLKRHTFWSLPIMCINMHMYHMCVMTCYMVHYIVHTCLTTGVLYNYLDIQCVVVTHVMLFCSL